MSKGHHYHRNSQVIVMPPTELEAHTLSEGRSGAEEPWLAPCGAKKLWMEYPRKITSIHGENFFLILSEVLIHLALFLSLWAHSEAGGDTGIP